MDESLGVRKGVLGYPSPADPREIAETAGMTSKVLAASKFSRPELMSQVICQFIYHDPLLYQYPFGLYQTLRSALLPSDLLYAWSSIYF